MARTWSVAVNVGGSVVTDSVTGTVRVTAEENQARTASVTFLPATGSYTPEDWIGADVLIDHVADPDGGATPTRIFTGKCNLPDLDETNGLLTLNCSDLLQEYFEGLADDAAILAVITGGKLADEVFGERDDGWQRTQDALSTVRKEVHKSTSGTVTLTDWAAKGTADYAYTSSGYVHQSPRVSFAERRQLVNSISISYQYRYARFKFREHSFGWQGWHSNFGVQTFCNWLDDNNPLLPNRGQFDSAIGGTGWPVVGAPSYGRLPEPGVYVCDGDPVIWIGVRPDDGLNWDPSAQDDINANWVAGASWTSRKRFAQTITEEYTLTVASSGSIALFGAIPGEDGAVYNVEADLGAHENEENPTIPGTYSQDAINDWVEDQGDRSHSDDVVECLLAIADNRIAGSHRQNYVEWQVPCEPALDLDDTAQITAGNVTAKGKVSQIQHTLDINSGSAITAIRVACSRGGAGTPDSLTAPTPPDTSPTHGAPSSSTSMNTYVGGTGSAALWDDADYEDESYVSTNVSAPPSGDPPTDPDQTYPRRVHIIGPEIEQEARDSAEFPASDSYNVAVPDDTLTVSL